MPNTELGLIAHAANRAKTQPFFFASDLDAYERLYALGDDDLASRLGCDLPTLARLALCRRPRRSSAELRADIHAISKALGMAPLPLVRLVRDVDTQDALEGAQSFGRWSGMLMAARDKDRDESSTSDGVSGSPS